MTHKIIIASLILFLLASFTFLTFTEQRQHNPDYQKNWWVVYFEDPKDESLNFVIENHSDSQNFHWELVSGKNRPYLEDEVVIPKGESKTIPIDFQPQEEKRLSIKVSAGEGQKEIYRYLAN